MRKNQLTRKILPVLLALLIVSVMPLYAASTNQVDRIPNVGVNDDITGPQTPRLIITEASIGQFGEFPEVFRLSLQNAEWFDDGHPFDSERMAADTGMGGSADPSITLRLLTDTLMEVTIETGGTGSEEAYWRIPLYSKAVAAGFATVSIESMDSPVTGGTYPYANVVGDPEGVLHVTLQLLGDDPLMVEPGDAVTDEAEVYLRIHESRANLIGTTPQTFRLVLENGRWFPDGTRGVDTGAMEADTEIQGTDENLVRQLRRINATTLELTLRSDRFATEPASILLPLYFEVPEEGEIALVFFPADTPRDEARFVIGTSTLPAPPEPEVTEVTFTVGQMGYVVDGETVIADVAPYIQPTADGLGRIMVPVRFVSDATGADEVIWDPLNRKVFVLKGETEIEMAIGSNVLLVDGEARIMDAVAEIQDIGGGLGRTMVPLAHLARALDVNYEWDAATRTVTFFVE